MNADDRTNRSDDLNPASDDDDRSRVDELWARCLRTIDAGQSPDLPRLADGDQQLLDELRELLETSSWLDDCIENEATTLRPSSRDSNEDTQPFVVERSDKGTVDEGTVGSLTEIIRRVSEGDGYSFGEYELLDIIGRGGMGVVFCGRQKAIGREVAIKMIAAGRFASRADIERFYSEARAASAVKHANIVTIYQVGEIDGHHFYSMDFIPGTDLAKRIRVEPVPPREAAELMQRVARAVEAAHSLGVVHRDLKPGNILIDDGGQPHVTDFGLAKHLGHEGDLTNTGNAMGTPGYMPPEQATGCWHAVGAASDVYSLGAILFAAMTGEAPFKANNPLETMWSVVHEPPPRPTSINENCDADLETIALKCLEKDPLRRYGTAGELADDLGRYLAGEPLEARPVSNLRHIGNWCVGIPIIAALTGKAVRVPTKGQQRAQAGMVLAVIVTLIWLTMAWAGDRPMPNQIRIAGGIEGGMYKPFANGLGDTLRDGLKIDVVVTSSEGSKDNLRQLSENRVHIALVQAAAYDDGDLAIIAPVFYEYVHVIARKRLKAKSILDLNGRRVSLGSGTTGSRLTATYLIDQYKIKTDPNFQDLSWNQLSENDQLDAAIVTVGLDNEKIGDLLQTGRFELLDLPDVVEDFNTRVTEFPKGVYGGAITSHFKTLKTPAFLVTHANASDELVRKTLDALYASEAIHPFPKSEAASWNSIHLHRAARKYFHDEP